LLALVLASCGGGDSGGAAAAPAFVHWENLSVHALELTPDGATLCVCNTPDNRLELFDVTGGTPVPLGHVPVGLDPLSVRARSNGEAWVVNHISDSVSVVDLPTRRVVATLQTADEPADIIFAGNPERAFVSCAQANRVLVFDPADLSAAPIEIGIDAEEPRALARSADRSEVYVAIFESGNGSTIMAGGADPNQGAINFPPNVVEDPDGPHGGVNPPPNDGASFKPRLRPGNPAPLKVGLIVKKDDMGLWRDDTGADWTELVSGPKAARSGRVPGWDLPDRDVAILNANTLAVRYATRCLNVCMAVAVQPGSGRVTVVGTDATNEVRFEPNLNGTFLRVNLASVDPAGGDPRIVDLNPHLDYRTPAVAQTERDRSVGDPRGIVWNAAGTRAYVTGMGSNNVVVLDGSLDRVGRIEVGEGPTGIVLSESGDRAFVLNRFEGSISVLQLSTSAEIGRVALFDPTPPEVKAGRKHLYDTHETSGLGHVSCASCHVDARVDRLAWDLGDPSGEVKVFNQNCITDFLLACEDYHPMKGPMTTQTLQDIIGKEPYHWRGDRDGLEEFNPAYTNLMGDDDTLTTPEMDELKAFLATIHFPPNPNRNFDNSMPDVMELPGQYTPGRFGPAGLPLPNGDPHRGLELYRTAELDLGIPNFQCVTCHTIPTGNGADLAVNVDYIPLGPNGEHHHAIVTGDGSTNISMKVAQLRSVHEKTGFCMSETECLSGFGYLHDGSVDTLAHFVSEPIFDVKSVQDIADLVAFLFCFAGSDLPEGRYGDRFEPPGPPSLDSHAALGRQATFGPAGDDALLFAMLTLARARRLDLVARSPDRGWFYDADRRRFQSDREGESIAPSDLRALAAAGYEITYTLVPKKSGRRIGIDRDGDGYPDQSERDAGTDPADPTDFPGS
jgi:YVTN family beta-propeller protein